MKRKSTRWTATIILAVIIAAIGCCFLCSQACIYVTISGQADTRVTVYYENSQGQFDETHSNSYDLLASDGAQLIRLPVDWRGMRHIMLGFDNADNILLTNVIVKAWRIPIQEYDVQSILSQCQLQNMVYDDVENEFLLTGKPSLLTLSALSENKLALFFFVVPISLAIVAAIFLLLTGFVDLLPAWASKVKPSYSLVIIFLLMIMLPNMLFGDSSKSSSAEQRTLSAQPQFSWANIQDYPAAYDAYYNDHLPLKSTLVAAYNNICWNVLNTSGNSSVIKGLDGWMFYNSKEKNDFDTLADYQHTALYSDEEMASIAAKLDDMRLQCEAAGANFYFVIFPNKHTIYGDDFLPSKYRVKINEESRTDQLVRYLTQNSDITVIYPKDSLIFAKEQADARGELLYQKTDTHWNEMGAWVAYEEMMRKMNLSISTPGNIMQSVRGTVTDLPKMLSFNDYPLDILYGREYRTDCAYMEWEDGAAVTTRSTDGNGKKLVMFRDSYAQYMMTYMSRDFDEVTYVSGLHFDADYLEKLPTDVIFELVERNVPILIMNGDEQ